MQNKPTSEENDTMKANLCLAALVLVFTLLTFCAYLLTDGRHHFVIPILRRVYPRCRWVTQHDNNISTKTERKETLGFLETDKDALMLGVKRFSTTTSLTTRFLTVPSIEHNSFNSIGNRYNEHGYQKTKI